MMLRGSVEQRGETVELKTIVDGNRVDSQIPGSAALVALVDAALADPEALPSARVALTQELGAAGLVDAAGVIGNFQRMVRIADATGIPVDARTAAITEGIRDELHLDSFASARFEA